MASIKIFITGASGYIGGSVLHAFLKSPNASQYNVTALVRSDQDIETIKKLGINVLKGSLDDLDILLEQSAASDIVVHTASSTSLVAAQTIAAGLSKRQSEGKTAFLLHTSGTSIIADEANGEFYSDKQYLDTDDIYAAEKADNSYPLRAVDTALIEAAEKGGFGISILAPPTIYGAGTGLIRRITHQVHYITQAAIKFRQTYRLGKGLSAWNHVHIEDLAALYVLLIEAARAGRIPKDPRQCYYFSETGEHTWEALSENIARILYAKGLVDSPKVLPWPSLEQAADSLLWGMTPYVHKSFSSNSRGRAVRSRELLGWKPEHKDEDFFDSLEEQINFSIEQSKSA